MTEEQIDEAIRLREDEGLLLKQIIDRVGGTESAWIYHFARLGVERGGGGPICLAGTPNPLDPTIKEMRLAGASFRAIARAVGRPASFVAYRLNNMARREVAQEERQKAQRKIEQMLRSGMPNYQVAKVIRGSPALVSSIRRAMAQGGSSRE